jgi:hypothetical protein
LREVVAALDQAGKERRREEMVMNVDPPRLVR